MQNKITAVIPAHNEERTIIEIINKVLIYCDYVVVVNDSSKDNTQKILNNYKNKKLIILEKYKKTWNWWVNEKRYSKSTRTKP